jgi:hypothetical protein
LFDTILRQAQYSESYNCTRGSELNLFSKEFLNFVGIVVTVIVFPDEMRKSNVFIVMAMEVRKLTSNLSQFTSSKAPSI